MKIEATQLIIPAKLCSQAPQNIYVRYDPEKEVTTININADTVTIGTALALLEDYFEKSMATLSPLAQQQVKDVLEEAKKQWIK